MRIEKKKIDELIPADYNPRKDLKPGDEEYEKLRRSIKDFGYTDPVVWNEKTGRVVGGHQRLKVMKEMGIKEIEVSVVNLDEKREKALNIALNKVQGEWDDQKLKDLLQDLDDGQFDVTMTGFDDDELEKLLTDVPQFGGDKPEMEFTQELLEEHNYVVLYFDNAMDWQTACDKLGIKTVKALDSKKGYERTGVGRVIRGADVIKRLK
jgi:ParB-like chromosome segregation protein Spo0J